MPLVYAELRRIASRQLRRLGGTPTISTTVLVHEVYERLVGHGRMNIDDERHFFAICARVMHQVVVDHAREHAAVKRGGGRVAVTLDETTLRDADCVVVTTHHTDIDWDLVARASSLIVDARSVIPAAEVRGELWRLSGPPLVGEGVRAAPQVLA